MDKNIKERWEAIDQSLVPKGYKKTKVGIIPEDWDIKKLGEVAEVTMGQSPDSKTYNKKGIGLPLIQGNSDIRDRRTSPRLYTSEPIKTCNFGDIIMAVRAPVGTVAKSYHKACIGRGVCSIRSINNNYMYYYLLNYEKNWIRLAQGSTFMAINSSDISNSKIPIPPLEEQERIADILSTWDRTIESYGKLLEENKERKKGLMQLLLTGEERLGGFSGPWKEVRLGDVIEERNETGFEDYDLLAITMKDGVVKRETINIKDTSSSDKSKYKLIKPGDIGYNTMRMWQGVSGVSEYLGIVSPAYTILKISNFVDSNYLGYLFKLPLMINKFFRYSQGLVKDTLNLKYNNFKVIKITLPGLEEQKAIAEVLSTADGEIDLLEKLIEELKEEKKGLMQLILKGIVRV